MVTLTWTPDQSPSLNLFFVFSPIYSWSVGEQFFVPAASWVFNFSTAMQASGPNLTNLFKVSLNYRLRPGFVRRLSQGSKEPQSWSHLSWSVGEQLFLCLRLAGWVFNFSTAMQASCRPTP